MCKFCNYKPPRTCLLLSLLLFQSLEAHFVQKGVDKASPFYYINTCKQQTKGITMNYADIKKYGKMLMVNGQSFIKAFDYIANSMWSCGLCSKANAKKNTATEIEKGLYGHEMYLAMKNIETLKAMDVLE